MNRLERLVNLVAALLDADRPLSRAEIRERVPGYGTGESARRAFERDKEALRAMGIPLVMEAVEGEWAEHQEGYRIPPEQYRLPDPGLAPDELAALHLAASTVRLGAAGDPATEAATTAIWKLGGVPGPTPGAPPLAALPGSEHLPGLFAAVGERRTVRFRYRSAEREVDPWSLTFNGGHWYLHGHDRGRGGERNFRLDRMETAPVAGPAGAFRRPTGSAAAIAAPWRMGDEEPVEALLLVDADQAPWAEARADGLVERGDDGSAVLSFTVTNRAAFRTFVLGFLDHAEVLSPDSLRADMILWLDALTAPSAP